MLEWQPSGCPSYAPVQRVPHLFNLEKTMTFNLEPNEAAFVVRVLGQLPTESGAFPLHQKLVAQFKEQENEPEVMEVGGTD